MKKILVTGSSGFMGRNLIERLRRMPEYGVLRFDVDEAEETLNEWLTEADVVFHLAGVNRPEREEEFAAGNTELTMRIVARLMARSEKPMLVLASSIQAALDNPYGRSKRKAEDAVEEYGAVGGSAVIFRLPNVFGKWSRPNYNSAVATFCYNIARDLDVTVSDPDHSVDLLYIDDVVSAFCDLLEEEPGIGTRRIAAAPVTSITLGALVEEIRSMRAIDAAMLLPDMADRFRRALFATYTSFMPEQDLAHHLATKEDHRGTLAEFLKSPHCGQIFISRTKPGCVRGNHYHDTKVEKFLVLAGQAVIRLRQIAGTAVLSFSVSGSEFRVVDIPPGYTHSIENTGHDHLVTLFWSSEVFAPDAPDTQVMPVLD